MSTRAARDRGIRPSKTDDEEDAMSETTTAQTERATVDTVLVVDEDSRSGILVVAGDTIPASHADLPRVARDTWQPL